MTQRSEKGQSGFFDFSARAKFRVTGADRFRFLNGQITNDLRKASETNGVEACVLSSKGKLNAHVFLSTFGESFLVDAEPDLRDTLRARLERYVIADDVQIEDVTDQFVLFHVLADASPLLEHSRIVSVRRFVRTGWDVWGEAAQRDAVHQQLSSVFVFTDSDAAEVMRIEQGIPRWGRELTEEIIPIEADLEPRTIDYEKGCYIGQEVISRMKMSGQTNKRLRGLISLNDMSLQQGMKLVVPLTPGKEAGWITSATTSERLGKQIALSYVKRGVNDFGTRLDALVPHASNAIPVEVVPLPFL
jgi:folate-binding protein YgfZ